ncbi:MAG: zf-HC2 domain-containing protein, partial [Frateuria sp.]|nr:zf-HC2 domain-containing protein [Frateuria sp.]
MSGRVLRFEGTVHAEADRLLPWLANGTLESEERAWVEQHLGDCAACQRELAWLQSLRSARREEPAPAADTARALRRLRRRLVPATGANHGGRRRP